MICQNKNILVEPLNQMFVIKESAAGIVPVN